MSGASARQQRNWLVRFTRSTRSHSASLSSAIGQPPGNTPALSTSAAETTREALVAARAAKAQVSIDLNYRAKLWSGAEAGKWMTDFMQYCDVLITTEEDVQRVFGISGQNYEDVAAKLATSVRAKTAQVKVQADEVRIDQ